MMSHATNAVIKLTTPITVGSGETITEVTMRVPLRKDLKKAQRHSKDAAESESFLFAELTGLTIEDIDAFTLQDSNQLLQTFRELSGESTD